MNNVRYGVIGVGGRGRYLTEILKSGQIQGAELTAVCDVKQDRLDWVKETFGTELTLFSDSHDLIVSGLVDAVVIATPHYFHPTIAIDAFENGLHVLTEKPIGVYIKKVYEMIDAAEKSSRTFGIMYNQRTDQFYQKMREFINNGELGALKRCIWIITDWYRTQAYYNSGGWRATWSGEGGGVLINQSPHNIDLWQWIFGMPCAIYAECGFGKYHDIEVEDDVTTLARYPNGATGIFVTTTGEFPGTNRLEITGSKGKLVYENGKLLHTKLLVDEREFTFESTDGFATIPCETVEVQVEGGHGTQTNGILQNFTNNILYGEELLAPGAEGIKGLSISNAMMLSAWKDQWVEIPNDGEEFWEHLQEKIHNSRNKEDADIIFDSAGYQGARQ